MSLAISDNFVAELMHSFDILCRFLGGVDAESVLNRNSVGSLAALGQHVPHLCHKWMGFLAVEAVLLLESEKSADVYTLLTC